MYSVCVWVLAEIREGLGSPKLEFQEVFRYPVWALGTEFQASTRASSACDHCTTSPGHGALALSRGTDQATWLSIQVLGHFRLPDRGGWKVDPFFLYLVHQLIFLCVVNLGTLSETRTDGYSLC